MASGRSGPPIKRLLEAIDGEQNGPSAKRLVQATITFSKTASRNGGRVQEETLTAEGIRARNFSFYVSQFWTMPC